MKKYIKPMACVLASATAIMTSSVEDYKGEYDGSQPLKSKDGFFDDDED